jgi:hypothetical protein
VDVTGGTVAPSIPQAATWDPDGADVMHRFMPSVAVDRQGDVALGYSTSSTTTKPAIKYAGRLATDPVNTFSQTEQVLVQGAGTQVGNCGGSTCTRWGDYASMTLDPDGCTFWLTSMYYAADGLNHLTRIGSFAYPECTPVAAGGTLEGTVTRSGGAPLSGATVALGSRTTTTAPDGTYSFMGLPAGTYPAVTASLAGFTSSTATSIVVTDGGATTQDFLLVAALTDGCFVDTIQADFQAGVATNGDLVTSPGDVVLARPDVIDQQNTTLGNQGAGFTTTTWLGQTFTAAITGPVTRVDINFFSLNCGSVTMPDVTIAIRNAAGNLPTGPDLATATVPGFCNGGGGFFTATFASPATITAGTQYAVVWRASAAIPGGTPAPGYFATVSLGAGNPVPVQNPYGGGRRASSSNSGTTWAGATGNANNDHGFKIYVNNGYVATGNLVSSAKDANPVAGGHPTWGTLSWTASTPAGTGVQFQAAASNAATGPFAFVGPDGTSGTFFSSGGSLSQFDGFRYLRYKALLTTSDATATPTLQDVTVCFHDQAPTMLTVAPASGTYGGTAVLTATLTSAGTGVAGKTVSFTLNGSPAGSGATDGSGVATVAAASLAGIGAGTYPGGVAAAFAGDSDYTSTTGADTLTVAKASQTITFLAVSDRTFGDADFSVSASASSGLVVTFAATGQCTVTPDGSVVHLTGAGSCTLTASQAGDDNYEPAADVPQTFAIARASQAITFNALPDKILGDPDFSVSASASSGLAVAFAASGPCTVTPDGATVHLTGGGSCTITASQAGDVNFNAAPDVPQTFAIADDIIFRDGFESGDTSAWTATVGSGDLEVIAGAAMGSSSFGLHAAIHGTQPLHVEDHTPNDESRYRVRFYVDTQDFEPGTAQDHFRTRIFLALDEGPTVRRVVAIVLRYRDGQYGLMGRARRDDGTRADTGFFPITPGAHFVEFDWQRSSSPSVPDGSFQLWIDGTSRSTLTGLDTDDSSVDTGRLGALSLKQGASGNLYFDQFMSRRLNYTGP